MPVLNLCSKCGKYVNNNERFCVSCGLKNEFFVKKNNYCSKKNTNILEESRCSAIIEDRKYIKIFTLSYLILLIILIIIII